MIKVLCFSVLMLLAACALIPMSDVEAAPVAQAPTMVCGETVTSEINQETSVLTYAFNGKAGQNVTITMLRTEGDMTESLHLYDATDLDNSLIYSGGVNLLDPTIFEDPQHTAIVFFTLPANGPYVIRAGRDGWWWGNKEGNGVFTLTLECDTDFGTQTHGGTLTCGDTVSDWIYASDAVDQWTFVGKAGQNVTVTMLRTEGDMNESLHLYNATDLDNSLIFSGGVNMLDPTIFDDPQHTAIVFFTLPADGTYVIRAGRDGWWWGNGEGNGAFTLTLECDTDFGIQTHGGTLTCGDTVTNWIYASNAMDQWTFVGKAGQDVTVTMLRTEGDMTESLHLYDAADLDNSIISSGGINLLDPTIFDDPQHTAVVFFTLPADGTYVIRAGRDGWWWGNGQGNGAFILTLDCDTDFGTQTHGGTLTCGDTVTDWIYGSNAVDTWIFDGRGGQEALVTMTRLEGDLVAAMSLYVGTDMDNPLVSNDAPDPAQLYIILMGTTLPADGRYVIRAGRDGWWWGSQEGFGEYSLTLSCIG